MPRTALPNCSRAMHGRGSTQVLKTAAPAQSTTVNPMGCTTDDHASEKQGNRAGQQTLSLHPGSSVPERDLPGSQNMPRDR